MSFEPTVSGEKVLAVLEEFPTAPSLTLAKLLTKRHPLIFTVETARTAIRYYRGARGKEHRHHAKHSASPLSELRFRVPTAFTLRDSSPYQILGCNDLGVISDLHFPYHSTVAVSAMLEYFDSNPPKGFLINGDLIDNHNQSSWIRDPGCRSFVEETEAVVQFLTELKRSFPRTKIWYKFGNHEERHEQYLFQKCPEIFGHSNFRLESILGLDRLKVQVIRDKRQVMFGKLSILHGHEYRGAIGRPVQPARWLLLRAKSPILSGHFHSQCSDSQRTINGDDLGSWVNGCLCNLAPPYAPFNEWSWGFSRVRLIDEEGRFYVDQKRISQVGKIYNV